MIGQKIKQLREERGWSQEQLAQKMGYISKSTINKIEKNINDVNQSTLEKFAKVFGCDPAELVSEQPKIVNPKTLDFQRDLAKDYKKILSGYNPDQVVKAIDFYKEYENLTPENQTAFRTLLKNLRSES